VARGDMMSTEDVLDILRIHIIGIVPEDGDIVAATNRGEPVTLKRGSRAGQAYHNIAARLDGEDLPFMNLELPPTSLLDRLSHLFNLGGSGGTT
ncbi:MAG: septum site-determining protein MinD, partial [Anaerolineae bacterium]